ncbi:Trypsin-7 [Eumeta japonica]|uniref:Trypsin-7 n=1 Tax=Eumeta variegata TaxID=151549 RepID=A0A4C1SW92_EUMVA|nr:Trypsin-7 [Eumeta japonica]
MYHPDVTALAGTQDLDRGGATYRVARGIRHHRYNFLDMDYDIGLFKLRTPVTYSHVLEVAPLAYRGPLFRKGMKFKISGWGWPSFATQTISRYLLQSEVLWMDQDTCREKRQNFSAPQSYRQFCSTIDNGPCMHMIKIDCCVGFMFQFDFGGPVIYNGTVIGIISGASWPCGTYPPIYTKVSAYDEWIVENMEELDRTV